MITISDKFRRTFPIAVTFVDGELPDAKKLNGLASQARSSTGVLEYAIGDIWNQAGDGVIGQDDSSVILTPSLGRAIGAVRKLSPRIPSLPNIEEYTHVLFDDNDGLQDIQLPFRPAVGSTFSFTGPWASNSASPKASKDLVIASGDWYVNLETGYLHSFIPPSSNSSITYKPIIPGDLGSDSTFNMIPDEDTSSSYAFRGLKIEFTNGSDSTDGYDIYLPPRGPLNTRANDLARPPISEATEPTSTENYQVAPLATNPRRFWQSDSENADISANATHYRYALPKILTNNWSSGAIIPAGFMYLYDPNSRTIVEGITMTAEAAGTPKPWFFHASGAALDVWLGTTTGSAKYPTPNLQNSGHGSSLYPALGLRVICIGVPLSDSFSDLLVQFLNHDHGVDVYGENATIPSRSIRHSNLLGSNYPDLRTPQLPPSGWIGDDHNQYVHRWGMSAARDKYYGGMFGDLLMLSTVSGVSADYQNLTAESNSIRFGDGTDGPSINYDPLLSTLLVTLDGTVSGMSIGHLGTTPTPILNINFPVDDFIAVDMQVFNGIWKQTQKTTGYNDSVIAHATRQTGWNLPGDNGDSCLLIGGGIPLDATDIVREKGSIFANRQFAGRYNDLTVGPYGYSASSAANRYYGPLRSHHVQSFEFTILNAVASFDSASTMNEQEDRGFKTVAGASTSDPKYIYMNFAAGGAGTYSAAFAPISLPYQKYGIVNVFLQIHTNSAQDLTDNEIFFTIGRKGSGSDVGGTSLEVDLYDLFTGLGSDETKEGWVFPVDSTDPLLMIDKAFTSTTETSDCAFVKFRGVGSSSPASIDIRSCIVLYRIWEF